MTALGRSIGQHHHPVVYAKLQANHLLNSPALHLHESAAHSDPPYSSSTFHHHHCNKSHHQVPQHAYSIDSHVYVCVHSNNDACGFQILTHSINTGEGSGNNYAYLVIDDKTKDATIIDPANPPEVLPVLKKHVDSGAINLKSIINTHQCVSASFYYTSTS